MMRNKFKLLLTSIHFADNTKTIEGDRLGKIQLLVDILQTKFQRVFCPGQTIVVDEILGPWRDEFLGNPSQIKPTNMG